MIDLRKWGVFGALIFGVLLIAGVQAYKYWRDGRAQAKVDVGQARASSEAGVAALNERAGVESQRARIDIQVSGGMHAIQSAPGSDAPVSAESRDAALAALCGMRSYRDDARCAALLGTGGGVGPAE